jgi:hypothetical protein
MTCLTPAAAGPGRTLQAATRTTGPAHQQRVNVLLDFLRVEGVGFPDQFFYEGRTRNCDSPVPRCRRFAWRNKEASKRCAMIRPIAEEAEGRTLAGES